MSHQSLHQMESAISLRYCPFPNGSKGFQFQAARPSRIHLRFNHATPLCVPQFSTTHPVTRSFRHANCMLDRFSVPSENEGKSGNKIVRGVTAVSLVLACVLGLFNISAKMNPKFTTAYAMPSQFELLRYKLDCDGRSALGLLLAMITDAQPSTDQKNKYSANDRLDLDQVKKLKKLAMGESKEELKTLEERYKETKDEEEKSYIGVALVEVYLCKGNFDKARELLDQQIDELIKYGKFSFGKSSKCDKLFSYYKEKRFNTALKEVKLGIAQRILYKAIVHTMLGDDEAKEWWKAFILICP